MKPEAIAWLPEFLSHYRLTNGVLMTEAYDAFKAEWRTRYADQPDMMAAIPSYNTICYQMKKLPAVIKQQGRVTGSEARQIEKFVRRDWNCLPVNYVWIGDGHGMKMKVAHPDHGNPFTPEVTFILDGCCRYIVGWSLALSESVIAVADALRYGIKKEGKPFIYYSDNGGGQTNNTFDADLTGILPRVGIDHRTGIPENPQGRGIIERLNRSLAMRISRQFATYYGPGADRNTVRKTTKALASAVNAQRKGTALTPKQQRAYRDCRHGMTLSRQLRRVSNGTTTARMSRCPSATTASISRRHSSVATNWKPKKQLSNTCLMSSCAICSCRRLSAP